MKNKKTLPRSRPKITLYFDPGFPGEKCKVKNGQLLSRRQFLLMGGGTTLAVLLGGAGLISGCTPGERSAGEETGGAPLGSEPPATPDTIATVAPTATPGREPGTASETILTVAPTSTATITSTPTAPAAQEQMATATPPSGGVACPFGRVNDPYPGKCKRYVDKNGDGFCDLSEPGSGGN